MPVLAAGLLQGGTCLTNLLRLSEEASKLEGLARFRVTEQSEWGWDKSADFVLSLMETVVGLK